MQIHQIPKPQPTSSTSLTSALSQPISPTKQPPLDTLKNILAKMINQKKEKDVGIIVWIYGVQNFVKDIGMKEWEGKGRSKCQKGMVTSKDKKGLKDMNKSYEHQQTNQLLTHTLFSCFYPSLTTFSSYLQSHPQKMIQLLFNNLDNLQISQLLTQTKVKNKDISTILGRQEEMEEWIVDYVRREVLMKSVKKGYSEEHIHHKVEEQKKWRHQFSQFWTNLSLQSRHSFLKQHVQAQYPLPLTQLDSQIQHWLSLPLPALVQTLTHFTYPQIFSGLASFKKSLCSTLKRQIELQKNTKKKRQTRTVNLTRGRQYNSQQKKIENQEYNNQNQQSSCNHANKVQGKRKRNGKKRKSVSLESNQTTQTQRQIMEKRMNSNEIQELQIKPQCKKEGDNGRQSKWQQSMPRTTSPTHYPQYQQQHKQYSVSSKKTIASQQPLSSPLFHIRLPQTISQHLTQFSDNISQSSNQFYDRRIVAFERIKCIFQYYGIQIKLFGSCANGIAVKESDVDIAVENGVLGWVQEWEQGGEGEKIGNVLQKIEGLFLSCGEGFKDIKVIKTATIPVMKLTIDTALPFLDPLLYPIQNRPHNCGWVSIDLTIQTFCPQNPSQSSHLGLQTTSLISKWLSKIPTLHTIIIVLKQYLSINRLNLTYEGGMNTICLVVLVVAMVMEEKMEENEDCGIVMQKVMRFYGEEFDQEIYGIDLGRIQQGKSVYYKKIQYKQENVQLQQAQLQIRDPICLVKNMTRNCYLYPQIKKLFQQIYQHCFKRPQEILKDIISKEKDEQKLYEMYNESIEKRNGFGELKEQMEG